MPRLVDTLNPARRITIRPEPARQFGSAVDLRVALLGTYPPHPMRIGYLSGLDAERVGVCPSGMVNASHPSW